MTPTQRRLFIDPNLIEKLANLTFKLIVVFGIVATMWLNQSYVTRKEFQATDERLRKIEDVLIRMETCSETNARQDVEINKLDERLRIVELKK